MTGARPVNDKVLPFSNFFGGGDGFVGVVTITGGGGGPGGFGAKLGLP